jgi:predicted O-methyltransferase YrrM
MNFNDFVKTYCDRTPVKNNLDANVQGWGSDSSVFRYVIERIQPESIVEVGSWLGASALHMASLTKAPIVCVDTFLGSNEVLWRENQVVSLNNNFSKIFNQFCANVTINKLNDQIVPLPMTSSSAAELLTKLDVRADLIYIDAGHRYREVYADLQDWWPLANKGLIGDDYSPEWPGVIQAANQFASENGLDLQTNDSKFFLFR